MGILDDAIREHLELKRRRGADTQEVSEQEREILGATADAAAAPAPAAFDSYPAANTSDDEVSADVLPAESILEAPIPEPLAGSPLVDSGPTRPVDDLFPGTGELLAAASETPPSAPPVPRATPSLNAPAPADADSETAARSGARRLSDEELAAWRQRLSERADRLAAQRPGTSATPAPPPAASSPAVPPAAPSSADQPPAYWSGKPAGAVPAQPEPEPPVSGVPVDFFDAGEAAGAFAPEVAPEPVEADDHDLLDETPDFLEQTPEHDRMWFEQRPPRDFDFG